MPRPITQFPVELPGGMVKIDLAYPAIKLGIELDGYAWHHNRATFDGDRRRDVELSVLGWLVLRFSWSTLKAQPELMIRSVRHHLETRTIG